MSGGHDRILALGEISEISVYPYVRNAYISHNGGNDGIILSMSSEEMESLRILMKYLVTKDYAQLLSGSREDLDSADVFGNCINIQISTVPKE